MPPGHADPILAPRFIKLADLDEDERGLYSLKLRLYERLLKLYNQQVIIIKELESII